MKERQKDAKALFDELLNRYPALDSCKEEIQDAYTLLGKAFRAGKKVLVAGNGGSAADSEHLVGELMKSFLFNRRIDVAVEEELIRNFGEEGRCISCNLEGCLPAIPLTSMMALSTAVLNDVDPLLAFAQMVYGYGVCGDVFLGISTSGNSINIINAVMTAKAKGLKSIGLTGQSGGRLKDLCDITVCVPEAETFRIQELHLPVYHTLSAMLEADFFEEK